MPDSLSSATIEKIKSIKLGVVCPMSNERETAERFVRQVLEQCNGFESVRFFAVFDKSCKDGTCDLLKELSDKPESLNVIWAPANTCVVDAYVRGYNEALAAGCDWILEIDAGFSHQPGEIPQFFDKMSEGYDCVFGSRFCEQGEFSQGPLNRRMLSRGGSLMANLLLGTKLKDMTSGFELFTKEALQKVVDRGIQSKGHFFQTEIKTYCRKMKICEVPIHYSAPSKSVGAGVVLDSLKNLLRLFGLRIVGKL